MPQGITIKRTENSGPPPGLPFGELSLEASNFTKLWVGTRTGNRLLISDNPTDIPVAGAGYLSLTGGTLSGALTVNNSITAMAPTNQRGMIYSNTSVNGPDTAGFGVWNTTANNGFGMWWGSNNGTFRIGTMTVLGQPDLTWWTADAQGVTIQVPLGMNPLVAITAERPPTNPSHVTNKLYVDANFLPLTGGTLTGALTLMTGPTLPLHAANKEYVDAHVPPGGPFLSLTGGTLTGGLAGTDIAVTGVVRANGSVQFNAAGDFTMYETATERVMQWAVDWWDTWMIATGVRNWSSPFGLMTFDGASLVASGNISAQANVSASGGFVQSFGGRVIATGSGNNPSMCVHDPSLSTAYGMWLTPGAIRFGPCDGSGTPTATWGYWDAQTSGHFAPLVSYTCDGGANAVMWGNFNVFNVPGDAFKFMSGPWGGNLDLRIENVLGDYTSGLDAILALRPVRYTLKGNWRHTDANTPRTTGAVASPHAIGAAAATEGIGLVPQDAETVMPEMFSRMAAIIDGVEVDDLRVIDPNALTYALINAVKELNQRLTAGGL